ncbi:MAG: hypothetical protein C0446_08360 [Chitinophaga sp.]|nr:hypothetical protein [Chitinophaga sp.]
MKHSVANYPSYFLGYVVSPLKICMQFKEVESKLRFKNGAEYIKLSNTDKVLPIKTTGTPIDILAIGCIMPVLEETQLNLIEAYKEYYTKHSDIYEQTYKRSFKMFLEILKNRIDNLLDYVNAEK